MRRLLVAAVAILLVIWVNGHRAPNLLPRIQNKSQPNIERIVASPKPQKKAAKEISNWSSWKLPEYDELSVVPDDDPLYLSLKSLKIERASLLCDQNKQRLWRNIHAFAPQARGDAFDRAQSSYPDDGDWMAEGEGFRLRQRPAGWKIEIRILLKTPAGWELDVDYADSQHLVERDGKTYAMIESFARHTLMDTDSVILVPLYDPSLQGTVYFYSGKTWRSIPIHWRPRDPDEWDGYINEVKPNPFPKPHPKAQMASQNLAEELAAIDFPFAYRICEKVVRDFSQTFDQIGKKIGPGDTEDVYEATSESEEFYYSARFTALVDNERWDWALLAETPTRDTEKIYLRVLFRPENGAWTTGDWPYRNRWDYRKKDTHFLYPIEAFRISSMAGHINALLISTPPQKPENLFYYFLDETKKWAQVPILWVPISKGKHDEIMRELLSAG